MSDPDLFGSAPQSLAKVLEVDESFPSYWEDEELDTILLHQLDAPVGFDLNGLDADIDESMGNLTTVDGNQIRSFRDLLFHQDPPLKLLEITKDFFKSNMNAEDGPVPKPVATMLYFSCLAVAQRCKQQITTLDNAAVRKGITWALDRKWIDDSLKELLEESLKV